MVVLGKIVRHTIGPGICKSAVRLPRRRGIKSWDQRCGGLYNKVDGRIRCHGRWMEGSTEQQERDIRSCTTSDPVQLAQQALSMAGDGYSKQWTVQRLMISITAGIKKLRVFDSSRLSNGTPVSRSLRLWNRHLEMQIVLILVTTNHVVVFVQVVLLVITAVSILLLV